MKTANEKRRETVLTWHRDMSPKAKSNRDVDKLLDSSLKKGFDVKSMTKDYVILTKQTSR